MAIQKHHIKHIAASSVLFAAALLVFVGSLGSHSLAVAAPSGEAMPSGNLAGWRQIFADDFTKDAATGSFGSDCDPNKIVYTGATGTKWNAYPKCYTDTGPHHAYRSDAVLSVHDGSLDFYLHNVDGVPAGANPSPLVDGTSQYQTYGRYSARIKVDSSNLSEYYIAYLLWPENDNNWQYAESDFPEGPLDTSAIHGFAHYGGSGAQDVINTNANYSSQWHTFTQEWAPGKRTYYVDGVKVGESTNQVFSQPQRWQLQTETTGNGTHTGHVLVDWVSIYAYSPGTTATPPPVTPQPPATTPVNNPPATGNNTGSAPKTGTGDAPKSPATGPKTTISTTDSSAPVTVPAPPTTATAVKSTDISPSDGTVNSQYLSNDDATLEIAAPKPTPVPHSWLEKFFDFIRNLF